MYYAATNNEERYKSLFLSLSRKLTGMGMMDGWLV